MLVITHEKSHLDGWKEMVPPWRLLALTFTAVTSAVTSVESRLRAAKLKLEGNNESSPLCLEPVEQTRGVSTAQCEFQSVGGVLVSNYPFIVHVASQQESVAPPTPPPPHLPVSLLPFIHIISCWGVCVEPNQITVWAPCVNLFMKTMFRFN